MPKSKIHCPNVSNPAGEVVFDEEKLENAADTILSMIDGTEDFAEFETAALKASSEISRLLTKKNSRK